MIARLGKWVHFDMCCCVCLCYRCAIDVRATHYAVKLLQSNVQYRAQLCRDIELGPDSIAVSVCIVILVEFDKYYG